MFSDNRRSDNIIAWFALALVFVALFIMGFTHAYTQTPETLKRFKAEDYVYALYTHDMDQTAFKGTAFKVSYRGRTFLMSVQHVCAVLDNVLVEVAPRRLVNSKVIDEDVYNDLCLLELPDELNNDPTALKLSRLTLKPNERLSTIGFPGGRGFKLTAFVIYIGSIEVEAPYSDLDGRTFEFFKYITIGGQSGSPVLNDQGHVIGIVHIRYYSNGGFSKAKNMTDFLDRQFK